MERQRLLNLIENKGTSSKEETVELWDIVRVFPYFQTVRLLLAKSFHNQESIHFHNELKTAAAYASDRRVLFNLINRETTKEKTEEESNVFAIEQKQPIIEEPALKSSENYSENQFAIAEKSEGHFEPPLLSERKTDFITPETNFREEVKEEHEEVIEEKKNIPEPLTSSPDEPSTTNEEIIRRRLSEILAKNKSEPQKKEEQKTIQSDNAKERQVTIEIAMVKEVEPITDSILSELSSQPKDAIEGLEIETIIEENYLQELQKLPEIIKPVVTEKESAKEVIATQSLQADTQLLSFIDWLKQKTANETTLEEVKDEPAHFHYEIEKASSQVATQSSELINKFIATAPRIVPVKAEFYSPSNMARQSIIDNEDIVSETLARIYFDQGNYPKARACYEKLSLLYPEKSASFAPLIEKIDNILKENQM